MSDTVEPRTKPNGIDQIRASGLDTAAATPPPIILVKVLPPEVHIFPLFFDPGVEHGTFSLRVTTLPDR